MATELTNTTQIKADGILQNPQVVLRIKGRNTIYGTGSIKKYVRIGDPDLVIGDAWVIGGINAVDDQLDLIDLSGSTNTISQQLLQDKGGTSSIPSIAISLVDKNEAATQLITPTDAIDILGEEAEVFLGYADTAFPQDFIRIFSGVIDEVQGGATIILNVAHPEQKKRAEIFQKITTELTADAKFRSLKIQHILYETRRDVVGTVTVNYTGGGTAGSEVVSVAGNNLNVQIENGVSTASQVRNAIEKSVDALSLVNIKIDSGFSGELQTTGSWSLGSDTTINVTSTKGMLLPVLAHGFKTYVRINDEIIQYTGMTATSLTGCTREAFKTLDERAEGAHHKTGDTVDTFYRLEGSAFDICLKVLLSGGNQYFVTGVNIKNIVEVEGVGPIANAVWFDDANIADAYGVTQGDYVTITGDAYPANNITDALIQEVVATPYGSYIILSGVSLVSSINTSATIGFRSKYNVLPDGLKLGGHEVDVPEFEKLSTIFSSSLFDYDFYLKDSVQGKDFLDSEVLFPTGAFTVPRKGKVSVGYTSPPLGSANVKTLNETNVVKPDQLRFKRSINRNFYNNVLFAYNESVLDDEKYLSGDLEVNQDSKNKIKVGNKTLVIKARGLRPSSDAATIIEILKRRYMDKYKFGAELVTVSAFYGKTFDSDIGDVVLLDGLNLPDTKKGVRGLSPRLFEIVNKSLSITTGEVKVDLLDSAYSLDAGRYGIISPSSLCDTGSTTTQIKIKDSYETTSPAIEKQKWAPYIGQKIIVHDENYDFISETILTGFAASDDYMMIVSPPLSFVPSADYIVDVAPYTDTIQTTTDLSKRVFVYTDPTVAVTSASNDTSFNVALGDATKFLEGAVVLVRADDWSVYSPEVKVSSVVGTLVTVNASLGFTPLAGYEIDLIGFKDGGAPYRYI